MAKPVAKIWEWSKFKFGDISIFYHYLASKYPLSSDLLLEKINDQLLVSLTEQVLPIKPYKDQAIALFEDVHFLRVWDINADLIKSLGPVSDWTLSQQSLVGNQTRDWDIIILKSHNRYVSLHKTGWIKVSIKKGICSLNLEDFITPPYRDQILPNYTTKLTHEMDDPKPDK